MTRFLAVLLCVLSVPEALLAQTPVPTRPPAARRGAAVNSAAQKETPDSSSEPFVIESYDTDVRFESDGRAEQKLTVEARVQSDAGAQQLHELAFRYVSPNQKIQIYFVRVRKADHSVVDGSLGDVKDVQPVPESGFSNLKEEHIAVPPLSVGDTLEYKIGTRILTPFAPGEFWFVHNFVSGPLVRRESLHIDLPAERKVVLKSTPSAPFKSWTQNGRTLYLWERTNAAASSASPKEQAEQQKAKAPDVQLTSFADWNALAAWYARVEQGRSEPTADIRAKVNELTRDQSDPLEKIQALYDFVSTGIRTVDIPIGQAGWQPHSASEVLANKYGDSADKNVLLAAMLQAEGSASQTALMPFSRAVDRSVPSPAQLEHAITVVSRAGETIWMDATTEVAPFAMLASPLRDKSALLISTGGTGKFAQTPADPPFASSQHVDIDGRVSALGKLTATARYKMRGDTELVLRLAFHRTPEAQWHDLAQTILSLDGIHGEVTGVKPGDPTASREPFELQIDFQQANFLDWAARRAAAPLPLLAIGLPDPPADAAKPIEIGSPLHVDVELTLALPANFTAQPPVGSSVARDYAAFKSSYRFADGVLSAERSLDFRMRRVTADRADDYRAFSRAVAADENRDVVLTNTSTGDPAIPSNATADELYEAGLAALNAGNAASAAPLLNRAVELDPQHKQGWNEAGLAELRLGKLDEAAAAFRKQLALDPADEHANEYLGLALERQNKPDQAADAYRKQVELNPLDAAAHAALGELLLAQRDDAHAAPELDKAAILTPDNAPLRVSLGRAYLNLGDEPKALAAFEKAASLSPTAPVWNDIAFNLAESKVDLDKAQHYADSAIQATSASLRSVDIQRVTPAQMREVENLAAYWDTFGWICFQKGDLLSAEKYVHAAWTLDQNGEIGDHLGQIYEKRGDKDLAIKTYALALAAPNAIPDTRAHLTLLLGSNSGIDDLVAKAGLELAALRTLPAGRLLGGGAHADFLIALSPGGKSARADAVRFISGTEELRSAGEKLKLLNYGEMFPDPSSPRLIRRARLSCIAEASQGCILELLPASGVPAQ
jgi:tetratricopeptide (TPR) repeat protein